MAMPTAIPAFHSRSSADTETPVSINAEAYTCLVDNGHFEGRRVELLEGVIVPMSPSSPEHDTWIHLLFALLSQHCPPGNCVRHSASLVIGEDSVPVPDLVVLPGKHTDYLTSHPRTAQLAIEVAITSFVRDTKRKPALYAQAGVAEYWVVDLPSQSVILHTGPRQMSGAEWCYGSVITLSGDDPIPSAVLANWARTVGQLFADSSG
jgi:Uma2 family endonuclease